jgi:pyruvate-formate lyase-activating enzyme
VAIVRPAGDPVSKPRFEDETVRNFLFDSVDGQHAAFRRWGLPITRVLILYNACGFRCFFCESAGTSSREDSRSTAWSQIEAHLSPAQPSEDGRLIIAGNEPLLHPDFERILERAETQGFTNIHLMTSGTWLSNPDDLARWISAGLRSIAVPIYALTPELHDEIVGAKAHAQLLEALDLAHASGVEIHLHTLALKRTEHELLALAELASRRWKSLLSIAPLREKEGQFRWVSEAMSLSDVDRFIGTLAADAPVRLVGFPACVGRGWPRGAAACTSVYFMAQGRTFAEVCSGCQDKPDCLGVVQAYTRHFGEQGLSPR